MSLTGKKVKKIKKRCHHYVFKNNKHYRCKNRVNEGESRCFMHRRDHIDIATFPREENKQEEKKEEEKKEEVIQNNPAPPTYDDRNFCCFCGDEISMHSQACGRCARIGSMQGFL